MTINDTGGKLSVFELHTRLALPISGDLVISIECTVHSGRTSRQNLFEKRKQHKSGSQVITRFCIASGRRALPDFFF